MNTIEHFRNTPNLWLETATEIAEHISLEPILPSHRVSKPKIFPRGITDDESCCIVS